MPEIKFDTGVQSFQINDGVSIEFNPTDEDFMAKLYTTFKELEARQREYAARMDAEQKKNETDLKQIFELSHQFDKEIREKIDTVLEKPICDEVFKTNVMALSGGMPVWANLMLAIIDKMDGSFDAEKIKLRARVKQYTNRWEKRKR